MHKQWFGDVYTYTHRALIHGVAPPKEWLVHPMLLSKARKGEEPGGGLETDAYARFLGLETDFVLRGNDRKRTQLVTDVASHPERHLFLDPYTEIGLYRDPETGRVVQRKGTKHITGEELGKIANGRQRKVVLVFDHVYLRVKGTA